MIGQVTSGAASQRRATEIQRVLGEETRLYAQGAAAGLPEAWAECDLIVSHLALGATTRIIAPLLTSKLTDPGVVVVDEAGRFVIPLVGGHVGGANELARRIADGLGATAVLSTATDAMGVPGLDTLGWAWSGDVAGVTRAILDGAAVELERTQPWPMLPLPENVTHRGEPATGRRRDKPAPAEPAARILVTDMSTTEPTSLPQVVLNPPSLVVGVGCRRDTPATAIRELVEATFATAGLSSASIAAITSVDEKADEPGLVEFAATLGVPLVTFPAEQLAVIEVPNPSDAPARAIGTPSVAEASVIVRGAELVVAKQRSPLATCAVGRLPARGKLSIVGIGPGARDLLTQRAAETLRDAEVVVGYRPYVNQIKDLLRPGARIVTSAMGREIERTSAAIEWARRGHRVALVSSGDPAIYAMASPTLELGTAGVDVDVVPGVTASLAASAVLGAPLGHDHATISLSDLHTDWSTIMRRVRAAAEADLVTVFYNPRSRKRIHQLPEAMAAMAEHRSPSTPVAIVTDATRPAERVIRTTMQEFDPEQVTMHTLVVVGSTTTRYLPETPDLMVTPRDYRWMPA